MLIRGITLDQARNIAESLDIRLQDADMRGKQVKAVLRPVYGRPNRYQRVSATTTTKSGEPRKVSSVCWHGYRDFMREVFKVNPDARIKTGIATYDGVRDFELSYMDTYDPEQRNMVVGMGSQYYGYTPYGDLCLCKDSY